MTRKTISVTREDICKGVPRNEHACPIATCLRRLFPDRLITVYHTYCEVGRYRAYLPPKAVDFAFFVDQHPFLRYFCKPFTFSLEFSDSVRRKPGVDFYEDPYYNSELA